MTSITDNVVVAGQVTEGQGGTSNQWTSINPMFNGTVSSSSTQTPVNNREIDVVGINRPAQQQFLHHQQQMTLMQQQSMYGFDPMMMMMMMGGIDTFDPGFEEGFPNQYQSVGGSGGWSRGRGYYNIHHEIPGRRPPTPPVVVPGAPTAPRAMLMGRGAGRSLPTEDIPSRPPTTQTVNKDTALQPERGRNRSRSRSRHSKSRSKSRSQRGGTMSPRRPDLETSYSLEMSPNRKISPSKSHTLSRTPSQERSPSSVAQPRPLSPLRLDSRNSGPQNSESVEGIHRRDDSQHNSRRKRSRHHRHRSSNNEDKSSPASSTSATPHRRKSGHRNSKSRHRYRHSVKHQSSNSGSHNRDPSSASERSPSRLEDRKEASSIYHSGSCSPNPGRSKHRSSHSHRSHRRYRNSSQHCSHSAEDSDKHRYSRSARSGDDKSRGRPEHKRRRKESSEYDESSERRLHSEKKNTDTRQRGIRYEEDMEIAVREIESERDRERWR